MKVIKYEEDGELYIRAFLIDATTNTNAWKVNSASLARNIETFIGMPLVLTSTYDHPSWVSGGIAANVVNQMRYAIGHIVKIFKDGNKIDAGIKITDPLAKEAIKNGDIPFYTSPRIVHDPEDNSDNVTDWMGIHLAVVDKPAYGVDKATFKGACYGSASECLIALKSAKKEECGFCVKQALEKLIVSKDTSQVNSSLDGNGKQSILVMDTSPSQTIDPSNFVSKDQFDAVNQKLAAFEKANADLQESYNAKINAINENTRKEKLTQILSAKLSDPKIVSDRVQYFMDAKVSAEAVEVAYKDHVAPKKDNTEQFTAPKSASASKGWTLEAHSQYARSVVKN